MDKGLKIFVAIHNRLAAELTKGSLSYLGLGNVTFTSNTSIAIEALLRDKGEILILDYANFKKDTNLLQTLKKQQNALIKIILIVTEDINANDLKELYEDGVSSVIKFPFQLIELQKAVSDTVRSIPTHVTDTVAKIRQLDFFSFMNDEEMLKLLRMTKCRKYKKNEILFDEGQPGDRFYVIIEGTVSILKVLADGKEELLARLEKGECFGEMAILEKTTRSARAKADDTLLLFELDSKLMDGYDDIITLKLFKKLAHIFSERLRNADKKIKELAQHS
jgi:CRP-like cAMP-binding protein/CheY-like chemotaxis protein